MAALEDSLDWNGISEERHVCVCVGDVAVGKQHTGIGWLQRNNLQYHHHHHLHQKQQQRHNSCDCPGNHHYLIIVDIIITSTIVIGYSSWLCYCGSSSWSHGSMVVHQLYRHRHVGKRLSTRIQSGQIQSYHLASMQPINKLLYNEYIIYDDIKYAIRVCNYPYAPTCFKHFNGTASKGLSNQILPPGTLQQYQESMDSSGSKLFLSPA